MNARIDSDVFLTANQVRRRYGNVSDMWLYRREHDNSNFPKPLRVQGRRFWRIVDLRAWEESRSTNDGGANERT
jgi:predicted DNA-binding transcriptional regulator AlpA